VGIFSKLFFRTPDRKNWSEISLNISKGLEEMRKIWFDSCVKKIQSTLFNKDFQNIQEINTHLEGEAELAIKAYQLYIVSGFLAEHLYIPPSEGKAFADILYAQVCGTKIEEILTFLSSYEEVHGKAEQQTFRFCFDVAKNIMGDKGALAASVLIDMFIPSFIAINQYVVAECFGDKKTAEELLSIVQKV
jgi:hypothetical protein